MEDYPSVLVPRTPPLNRGGALAINVVCWFKTLAAEIVALRKKEYRMMKGRITPPSSQARTPPLNRGGALAINGGVG